MDIPILGRKQPLRTNQTELVTTDDRFLGPITQNQVAIAQAVANGVNVIKQTQDAQFSAVMATMEALTGKLLELDTKIAKLINDVGELLAQEMPVEECLKRMTPIILDLGGDEDGTYPE